ncbi:MAG: hypothetical protein KAS66_08280 [Candidatus Omnitrophica bacterium]|nr:hypothetical protein [Candidatus Omnitrophota bacterium]
MGDVILGTGLSALIWGFHHPDSILIGGELAGGMVRDSPIPFYLHEHPATKQMLEDLNLSTDTKNIEVRYRWTGSEVTYPIPPVWFRDTYYCNTREIMEHTQGTKEEVQVPCSVMNADKSSFKAYKVTGKALIKALEKSVSETCTIFRHNVEEISFPQDRKETIIKTDIIEIVTSEKIISTIPALKFKSIKGCEDLPITREDAMSKIYTISDQAFWSGDTYDMLYQTPELGPDTSELKTPSRIIRKRRAGVVYDEYTVSSKDMDTLARYLPILKTNKDIFIYPDIAVRNNLGIMNYRNVQFLGRGACWHHDIKIENVIQAAVMDREIVK